MVEDGGLLPSQNDAAAASLALLKGQQGGASGGLEDIVDALAAQTGAFEVFPGSNFLGGGIALLVCDKAHRLLSHFLNRYGILAEILLQSDEDDGDAFAESSNLFHPL